MGNLKNPTMAVIAQYTKEKVQIYRENIDKKDEVLKELSTMFSETAEEWKKVVDRGRFRKGFTRVLGVGGMRALKELLCDLDRKKYHKYDFGTDNVV